MTGRHWRAPGSHAGPARAAGGGPNAILDSHTTEKPCRTSLRTSPEFRARDLGQPKIVWVRCVASFSSFVTMPRNRMKVWD